MDSIASAVHYNYSKTDSAAQHMKPLGGDWSPPACWYEPQYKPQDFEDYLLSMWREGSASTIWAEEYGADNYHKGDDGTWYGLVTDDNAPWQDFVSQCAGKEPFVFVGPANPPPRTAPVIDTKALAGLAYNGTTLPAPPLTLRPVGANQLVNLDTEVTFAQPLDRVWVTAMYDNAEFGIHLAATTVATPDELRVDAGTTNADPSSCTYKLTPKGGGAYSVDTSNDPCNITYRKHGDYTLQATLVWNVTWTPSANPDGPPQNPPFPQGQSTTPLQVTVKENQTIVN
ncbi:hypothetical protein [Streptomyces sp. CA-111067]|uniref:hypothetical protein n=1 Tax=Streptomyces sp. CA-111067 TaxID=3240046 RepID=UPI003D95AAA2